jgi:hypothetical protein
VLYTEGTGWSSSKFSWAEDPKKISHFRTLPKGNSKTCRHSLEVPVFSAFFSSFCNGNCYWSDGLGWGTSLKTKANSKANWRQF